MTWLFPQVLEIGRIYNVKKEAWHATAMSVDASMLIVENRDTTDENSDYSGLTAGDKSLILETARREL